MTNSVYMNLSARRYGWCLWLLAFTITTVCLSASALEPEKRATLSVGEKTKLWFGANYGKRCRSAGPPVFHLTSKPALGEVTTEESAFTAPAGGPCQGDTYTGLIIWYKAGKQPGTDVFTYTVEFPHELGNPQPSSTPHLVTATVTVQ